MVNINLEIPEETHKRIKILAATEGVSLKDLIIRTLDDKAKELKIKV